MRQDRRRRGLTRAKIAGIGAIALAAGGVIGGTQALATTPVATTLTLTASPASPQPVGTTVLFTVSISPTTAVGNVRFSDGPTLLGSGQHYQTRWTYSTSTLAAGTHMLNATFTADDSTAYGSSSVNLTYVVGSSGTPSPSPTPTPTATPTPTPTPTTTSTCALSAKLVPSCGVLWGVYKPPASGENLQTAYTNLEGQVGRKFDIIYRYHDMSNSGGTGQFPDKYEQALYASGHLLLANWASRVFSSNTTLQWSAIAAGKYDASVIDPEAARIKAFGKPIMLSLDAEMDARVGTMGTAADYVAAFRHIHDRFAADGVTNVVWVWTITGSSGHDSIFPSLYPGNAYVDWVGFDPYNFYNCQNASGTWRSPSQLSLIHI